MVAEHHRQVLRRKHGDEVTHGFHERLVRDGQVLVAGAEEDDAALLVSGDGGLGGQSGLPDPGFAGEKDDPRSAFPGPFPGLGQRLQLARPADEGQRPADYVEQVEPVGGDDVGDVDRPGHTVHRHRVASPRRSPRHDPVGRRTRLDGVIPLP